MLSSMLIPAFSVGGLGLLFGALLAIASIAFRVEKDEKMELIEETLPGANCGGCGYAGCNAYASAVVNGAKVNLCVVGGAALAEKIAQIMGVEVGEFIKRRAIVMCDGTCDAVKDKYDYEGLSDCVAASRFAGGPKGCSYGCLGFGSCASVCAFDAIKVENGVAVIDEEKCTACGRCVEICPKGIIKLVKSENRVSVLCSSKDKGPRVREVCSKGCIACKICEKTCRYDAIKVVDNVARIDEDKCTNCGECLEKCPTKIIRIFGDN